MSWAERIRESLTELRPGMEVTIVTRGGRRIRGAYEGLADDDALIGRERIALDEIDDVLLDVPDLPGPE